MTDDIRTLLAQTAGHAADYREAVATDPRPLALDYHAMRERVMQPVPEAGSAAASVIEELVALCDGGLMPITGPRFFGWVMGGSHPAGVAADWLVSAWGQNAAYHTPTPAAAAIEDAAESWLLELLDLPRESGIGFTTGATMANAIGLAAARTRVLRDAGWDPDADGLFGAPPVHVLIGEDAHSSLYASLQLIGFGSKRVVPVATDGQGRMLTGALEAAIAPLDGPKIVIGQAGQINTGSYDPFSDIIAIGHGAGAWVHIDGAFGLWARAAPAYRHLTDGIEAADSWVTDGHKWLQAPYDTGFAIVRDKESHERAMTQWSSYLPAIGQGDRVPSALVPELSRRARGVPVWAVIKALGRAGIAAMIERHCGLTLRMADLLGAEPGVRIHNEVTINQLIVSFGDGEVAARHASTEAVIAAVQQDGTCFVAGASWRGEWVMRISIVGGTTSAEDVERSAAAIIAEWRAVQR